MRSQRRVAAGLVARYGVEALRVTAEAADEPAAAQARPARRSWPLSCDTRCATAGYGARAVSVAEQTRTAILDAARDLILDFGVCRTNLSTWPAGRA